MRKLFLVVLLAPVLVMVSASSVAEQTVREFSGTENALTDEFAVESPWLLDWRLNGDYSKLIALDITLVDATTGRSVGRVLHTQRVGNGVKLFETSGRYQLRVSSTLARWNIHIVKITPEEAKQYTPSETGKPPNGFR